MGGRSHFRAVGLSMAALLASTALAGAQTLDLGSVGVAGSGDDKAIGSKAAPGTAAAVAPTQASLDTIEPQSIISDKFISDALPPESTMADIVKFAPSVSLTGNPNGPGGTDAKIMMRGFSDGQYNITVDGVPFGDANDPSHHSAAYWPAGTLSKVVIDRGPGLASTIGYSTFGGSVNLFSRELTNDAGGHVDASWGSFGTQNYNFEAQSGVIAETGTKLLFNYDNTTTDGALQNAGTTRRNYMLKFEQPIGERWNASFVSSVENQNYYNIAQITLAQAAKYGKSYAGLSQNPSSSNFAPYNETHKDTDFEILTLTGDAGLFQVDNKTYTYSYINKDLEQKDQTVETTKTLYTTAQLKANPALAADVMGLGKENRFRAYGDVLTVSRDVDLGLWSGTARSGAWVEHINNTRYLLQRDDTLGVAVANAAYPTAYQYNILSKVDTVQPFVEYEWKPTPQWSITPGYKHYDFTRDQYGNPNQTDGLAQAVSANYQADLPYLTARYRILPELSVYGQYAKGIQAPPVANLYVANPQNNNAAPQKDTNYQVGVVWKNDRVTADFDLYLIDFSNMIQQEGSGVNTYYDNAGGVYYKGIEGEATVVVGEGVSLYSGGSINNAVTKGSKLWVSNAPDVTASGGVLYEQNNIFGSLLTKYVGHRYAGSQVAGTDFNRLKPYNSTDLVIGYRLDGVVPHTKGIKLQFGIENLFDHHTVTDASSMLSGSTPTPTAATYYWMAGRSYFGKLSVAF